MKALLLVGGQATRLRPLSIYKPKCLFPLNNKPIIDHLLENLAKNGCTEAILAVNNLSQKIKNYLGNNAHGIKITYSHEQTPLGTGGPIKLAEKQLNTEPFLVLNGDILSHIPYKELLNQHKPKATITLKQVTDPTRYGVVKFGSKNTILEFVEKPPKDKAPSNWINAGCYALSPPILDIIPKGKVSIERQVFPILTSQGTLHGYKYNGPWIDIGVPQDYLQANKMLLENQENSSIDPTTTTGSSNITSSIIWDKTKIKQATVTNSIIGSNVTIGKNVEITNSVIADNVKIHDNVKIIDTKIWPDLRIKEDKINKEIGRT